jgi:hypothetical protein
MPNLTGLGTKVRQDPLGPSFLNLLRANIEYVRDLGLVEHQPNGTHNALEVPRTAGRVTWGGASYATSQFLAGTVTAVSNPAVGVARLTLGAGLFNDNLCAKVTNGQSANVINAGYAVVNSATQVDVYLPARTVAPNTWAQQDVSFDVELYSDPLALTSASPLVAMPQWRRDDSNVISTLQAQANWNPMVQNFGELRQLMSLEHDLATGLHPVTNRFRADWGYIAWSGAAYSFAKTGGAGTAIPLLSSATITRPAAGQIRVTFAAALSNANYLVFVDPDCYRAAGDSTLVDINLVSCPISSRTTTQFDLFLNQYNVAGNSWAAADFDVLVSIHLQ